MKYIHVYTLLLMFVYFTSCKGQNQTELPIADTKSVNKEVITTHGPKSITRNLIQDRKGNFSIRWRIIYQYYK